MFYLKYRPQTIEEIDNQEIRQRIKTLVKSKKIPHAMLFSGPKGTGKTSTARILAKIINCQENLFSGRSDSIEPCNHCSSCQTITKGHSVDVVEIDAASNRGIDQVKELINQVKFYPLNSRYKVYIIDEVHMLTKEAFNAFLKTLEEPPSSTIFILATTEIEKLPKTVVSRCLKFNFAKAKETEILRMLSRISKSEKIDIEKKVLEFIAKHADHSFRDGAKLLEELVIETKSKKGSKPTVEKVKEILGLNEEYNDLIQFLEKKDLKNTVEFIEKYDKKGGNFKVLIESLLDKLHLILLKKNQLETNLKDDYNFSLKEITLLIKLLQRAYNELKYSPIEVLPLEVALVEYLKKIKTK